MIIMDKDGYAGEIMKEYLNQWNWEWFLTLNLGRGNADSLIKRFARELGLSEKLRIACQGVVSFVPQRHIHLLALGKNRHGKTPLDCNIHAAERLWGRLTRESAVIRPVYDTGAVGYIVDRNMKEGHYEMLIPYNKKLLEKSMIRSGTYSDFSGLLSLEAIPPVILTEGVSVF